ncbi:Cysteine-rich membrane protein 2 [Spironucleus salmonicida]|uniref:Cysteine-rich membrane protein 2 n=1 Tax=Spironucleus salmonicida TaxID=348837 RepID=V6LWG1_9EUKA|nr:Cysteine-rich membrane protein 2 [Spironucleus salmonicida]KAH0570774.1 Cysteine-rich membrane protein 2 [Spironucleus salmonicida]|eukprot:EST48046.1 Cysteine-rich membrane protein 2 [Spironucleus salmonicida]
MAACSSDSPCPNFSYCPESGAQVCTPCSENCTSCISTDICEVCAEGFVWQTNGRCAKACDSLQIMHFCNNGKAEICSPLSGMNTPCSCGIAKNCAICSSPATCFSCLQGFQLNEDGSCDSCLPGSQQIGAHCYGVGNSHAIPDWQAALIIFLSLEVIWGVLGMVSYFGAKRLITIRDVKAQIQAQSDTKNE